MTVQNLKEGLVKKGSVDSFPTLLKLHEVEVAKALPEHLKANIQRYARLALTQYRQNPKLAECDPNSIFAGVILASQLGLELGVMGQGYLVPYGGQAQFVPGWRGIVDLVHRSGRAMVFTGCVYEGDAFEFQLGDSPYVRHVPKGEDDENKIVAAYSIGRIKDLDYPIVECWPINKIKRHLERFNKVGKRHYAYENMEMYARKVVLLQTVKYLPASVEVNTLAGLDHQYQSGVPQQLSIGEASRVSTDGLMFPGTVETTALPAGDQTATAAATTTTPAAKPAASQPAQQPVAKPAATTQPAAKPAATPAPVAKSVEAPAPTPAPPPVVTQPPAPVQPEPQPEPVQAAEPEAPAAELLPQEESPAATLSADDDDNEPGEIIRRVQFPKRYARLDGEAPPEEELKEQARAEAALLGQDVQAIAPHWLSGTAFDDLNRKSMVCLIQALKNVPRKAKKE